MRISGQTRQEKLGKFGFGTRKRQFAATCTTEAVGKLVCEHVDLLKIVITVQDLAPNERAQAVELQPSCWCE
jgi:hypothetical protein